MRTRKVRKLKITRGEKLLYTAAVFCAIFSFASAIFCGANIGNLKMNVEKLKYDITAQENKNESLTMKVNELTSFDKVKDVAKEMGLEYNNDNIVIINK
jgi:Protein required for the initiation of cell division